MKKLKLWMTQWLVDIGSCLTELGDRMIWKGVDMGDDLLRDDDELLKYAKKKGSSDNGRPFLFISIYTCATNPANQDRQWSRRSFAVRNGPIRFPDHRKSFSVHICKGQFGHLPGDTHSNNNYA